MPQADRPLPLSLLEKARDIAHRLVEADRDIDPNGIDAELLADGADQTRVLAHALLAVLDASPCQESDRGG